MQNYFLLPAGGKWDAETFRVSRRYGYHSVQEASVRAAAITRMFGINIMVTSMQNHGIHLVNNQNKKQIKCKSIV